MRQEISLNGTHRGLLVVSDIHAMHDKLALALKYATDNDLHVIFLGDLVDGGHEPFEVVRDVYKHVCEYGSTFVCGNHDDKWYRAIIGNKVTCSEAMMNTYFDVPHGMENEFLDTYAKLVTHDNSCLYASMGDLFFSHGALHKDAYDPEFVVENKDRYVFMYGQTNGKRDDRAFPIRLYEWADNIPAGKTVFVGHDRAPFGKKFDGDTTTYVNSDGGRVIFTDTGCGKNEGANLTCVHISESGNIREFVSF